MKHVAEVKEAAAKTAAAAVDAMEAADTEGRAYYYTTLAQRTIIVTLAIVESLP